jgi:hypothetical protein
MINLISKPWAFVTGIFGLLFPMFGIGFPSLAGDAGRLGRWSARAFVLAIVLAVLWTINQSQLVGMANFIANESVRSAWLPFFFLCIYAMFWLAWWLYRVLSMDIDPDVSDFPDIDHAWDQAVQKMKAEEIHPDEVPLFLVLGWPSVSEDAFFRAAGVKAQVKQHPNDPGEPLHVTANRHGIWVTCPGASLLGQVNQTAYGTDEPGDRTMATMIDETVDPSRTMGQPGAGEGTMRIEDILAEYKKTQNRPKAAGGRTRRGVDNEMHEARLKHLCRLIARDRQGFCPVNGVLVLLPVGVADPGSERDDIARACRTDLTAAFAVFRLRCPVLAMICGLETLPGFEDLVKLLPPEARKKRIGQRFPLVPELAPAEVPVKLESSVESIATGLFPSMVQTQFQVEAPGAENIVPQLRVNSQLFRFMTGILEKRERLARLVKDCLPVLPGQPIMFGGCYFAATGSESDTQQAFASGVLTRMMKEDQNSVTWTEDTLADDAKAWRRARFLKWFFLAFIAVLALVAAALIAHWYFAKEAPNAPADETKAPSTVKKSSDDAH